MNKIGRFGFKSMQGGTGANPRLYDALHSHLGGMVRVKN